MTNTDDDMVIVRIPRKQVGKMLHQFGVGLSRMDPPEEGNTIRDEIWDLYYDMQEQVGRQRM